MATLEELMEGFIGRRPPPIKQLSEETSLDIEELKMLYRDFKNMAPNGLADLETFKNIFKDMFHYSDGDSYADYVFQSMTGSLQDYLDFHTFSLWYSKFVNGTLEERLEWIFSLYDLNGNGRIDFEEINKLLVAIHELTIIAPIQSQNVSNLNSIEVISKRPHMDLSRKAVKFLQRYDTDRDGFVSKEDFVNFARKDKELISNIEKLFPERYSARKARKLKSVRIENI